MTTPLAKIHDNPRRAAGREIDKLDRIRALGLAGDLDEAELHDLVEGETDLIEVLAAIGEQIQMFEGEFLPGVEHRIQQLEQRKKRMKATAETLRNVILMAMERADLPTVKTPCFTMSAKRTAPGLIVEAEADVPTAYWTPQPSKLNRQRLRDDLKNGVAVPGARLDNGGATLAIKVT